MGRVKGMSRSDYPERATVYALMNVIDECATALCIIAKAYSAAPTGFVKISQSAMEAVKMMEEEMPVMEGGRSCG